MKIKVRSSAVYSYDTGMRKRSVPIESWTIQNERGQGITLSFSHPFRVKKGEQYSVNISLKELVKAVNNHYTKNPD